MTSALVAVVILPVLVESTPDSVTIPPPPDLAERDVALIGEMQHLQHELGHRVWPGWDPMTPPVRYTRDGIDFLINHPEPPVDYRKVYSPTLADTIWVRTTSDSVDYAASYPIGGHWTVVMTAPTPDEDPRHWALAGVHEMFHVHQGYRKVVNPFVADHAAQHELSFTFPYGDTLVRAAFRIEADLVFRLITSDGDSTARAIDFKVYEPILTTQRALFADTLLIPYKQHMEWSEGVARFTEREIAALARDGAIYRSSERFRRLFPDASYEETWSTTYARMLYPIRFVGDGVHDRAMFYYLGMGKAYLLDWRRPGWRSRYRSATLDDLLLESSP